VIRSLRKGHSSAYFQHAHTGHNIGVEKFECEVHNGKAVVRFSLRPVDGNQRHDQDYLHTHALVSVEIHDDHVIKGLRSYLEHRMLEFSAWQLQVISRGTLFSFPVTARLSQRGSLKLSIEATGG